MLKRTPLYSIHKKLNAKIVPFAGFEMPLSYDSILREALYTRKKVSCFDVSHMGEIEIRGKDALSFLSYLVSSDPSKMRDNHVQYAMLLNENGGIVDDLLIYKFPDRYFLVVNAVNTEKDYEFLLRHKRGDVEIYNISEKIAQIAVQGPLSEEHLRETMDLHLSDLKFYRFKEVEYNGIPLLISRTGYTGEDGFEIYTEKASAEVIWNDVFKGEIKPAGLGARDILRLEMGYPLYGHEHSESITPIEAGLKRFLKTKDRFIGRKRILRQIKDGIEKKLIAFYTEEKGSIPRGKMKIYAEDEIGYVTSGSFSPTLGYSVGMGYVDAEFGGEEIYIEIRGKKREFKLCSLPFVKKTSLKKK